MLVKKVMQSVKNGIHGNHTFILGIHSNSLVVNQETHVLIAAEMVPAVVAEWLRRWTRNPLGYSRTGSNPVDSVLFWSGSLIIKMMNLNHTSKNLPKH